MAGIVGSEEIIKQISSQIESQFPAFIREEGPQFIAFLKAYYEYMEQSGSAGNAVRSLYDNQDIDRTVNDFIEYFRREFMIQIPSSALADKALLAKHIREFYRSRGSQESYKFLFRVLYNKEIDFYYPGDDILRASDGRWIQEVKLRVTEPFTVNPQTLETKRIRGEISGARASVLSTQRLIVSGVTVYDLSLENVIGTFQDGEKILSENNSDFVTVDAQIGSIREISVLTGGAGHSVGDSVEISGAGSTRVAEGRVTAVTNDSAVTAKLIKQGSGYTLGGATIVATNGSGTGFAAKVDSYTRNDNPTTYNIDTIGSVKDVLLNSTFFAKNSANSATVLTKLVGTLKTTSGSNTVIGQGTLFNTQLAVGDIVRVKGVANTLRVHSVTSAQSFITATSPTTSLTTGANAYVRLAGANVSTILSQALTFRTENLYSINAISIINPGSGYQQNLPILTVIDNVIGGLDAPDGYGGILGRNAVVTANNLAGTIVSINVTNPGENFNRSETSIIRNTTISNTVYLSSHSGVSVRNKSVYLILDEELNDIITEDDENLAIDPSIINYEYSKRTFNGTGLPITSGVITFPGKYIDTKGFLSWNNRLQDNYYYQDFSYVIKVSEVLSKYKQIIKDVLHPVGTKMFGEYTITSNVILPPIFVLSQSRIQDMDLVESISITDEWQSVTVLPGNTVDSFSSNGTFDSYRTFNVINGTESVSLSDINAVSKLQIAPNLFVSIQVANDVIDTYSSTQVDDYGYWPVGTLDGTTRLVSNSAGNSYFANSSFSANTGLINVGGDGSQILIMPVGSSNAIAYQYQVNAIISNTYFTIRTEYAPGNTANAYIYIPG